jgi:hypothetical protein
MLTVSAFQASIEEEIDRSLRFSVTPRLIKKKNDPHPKQRQQALE